MANHSAGISTGGLGMVRSWEVYYEEMTAFQRVLLIIHVGKGYLLELQMSIIRMIAPNRIMMWDQQMGEWSQVRSSKAL